MEGSDTTRIESCQGPIGTNGTVEATSPIDTTIIILPTLTIFARDIFAVNVGPGPYTDTNIIP